jgi:hypothetical protein
MNTITVYDTEAPAVPHLKGMVLGGFSKDILYCAVRRKQNKKQKGPLPIK